MFAKYNLQLPTAITRIFYQAIYIHPKYLKGVLYIINNGIYYFFFHISNKNSQHFMLISYNLT
ncbi:hypothetical protein AUP88_22095 [Escherichia coli]|nr:hypothetical protein AUP88_22095 [Escherichia coli]